MSVFVPLVNFLSEALYILGKCLATLSTVTNGETDDSTLSRVQWKGVIRPKETFSGLQCGKLKLGKPA